MLDVPFDNLIRRNDIIAHLIATTPGSQLGMDGSSAPLASRRMREGSRQRQGTEGDPWVPYHPSSMTIAFESHMVSRI